MQIYSRHSRSFRTISLSVLSASGLLLGGLALRADESRSRGSASPLEVTQEKRADESSEEDYVPATKAELRRRLNRIQYDVTQNAATEPAFSNAYWNNKKTGEYHCIVCDKPLFDSKTKFKSGTGWPSFYLPIEKDAVGYQTDYKMIYPRTEVHCKRCKAHLGHLFDDGPAPSGKRFCMNSASMKFVEAKSESKK
ncbi:MAG TPA: peptide-methionine (R)-S-oxide reductase [Rhodopirellula baltica]|uniref:peptide-methionine (R)-S-oxide reductase n=1 Tax=Rhodopirellula baltica (strain DSM 10527 / NCIMB 13988 / SH1) TaxID=243090 RepID=Q7UMY6_RHOBA|nr:peptide-methionine (R)-S-oxide reductase MsrB [Rhodopirellula baltica]CAD75638.1 probable peptide methionine sulfoxide reductase msrB [Rhodopirellula baltica SH 1]HBE65826.1 peptide-methionine (R)-S-oxide reductase [Rhodopirellula baltica]